MFLIWGLVFVLRLWVQIVRSHIDPSSDRSFEERGARFARLLVVVSVAFLGLPISRKDSGYRDKFVRVDFHPCSAARDCQMLLIKSIPSRSTIVQHLLNDSMDPFNRQPLTEDMVQPQTELRQRIEDFLAKKGASPTNP